MASVSGCRADGGVRCESLLALYNEGVDKAADQGVEKDVSLNEDPVEWLAPGGSTASCQAKHRDIRKYRCLSAGGEVDGVPMGSSFAYRWSDRARLCAGLSGAALRISPAGRVCLSSGR